MPLLNLDKNATYTICQRKNRSTEFHLTLLLKWTFYVHVHIHKKMLIWFFFWEKYIILCNLCKTGLARAYEFKWQRICVCDFYQYSFMIFCAIFYTNHGIGIYCVQYFPAMWECWVWLLAHSLFHFLNKEWQHFSKMLLFL